MSNGPNYTTAEDDIIRRFYPTMATSDLVRTYLPLRTAKGIRIRASRLGAIKDRDRIDFGIRDDETMIGHLTECERGYLAGILDGEGCIHLALRGRKNGGNLCVIQVSVSNTSKKLIDWLLKALPSGSYECAPVGKPNRKIVYRWVLAGTRKAKILLRELAPYLVIKRDQAEAAASYRNSMSQDERHSLFHALREMKRLS